ncbi:MAG: hypothetical protein SPL08_01315 [Pseudomonadota bacterium]|nr:hypothetical protein [Pseudomonadota bacterium]
MLNDNEFLYIVPLKNVSVPKATLNKDFNDWSILNFQQLIDLYGSFKKITWKRKKSLLYLVKKFDSPSKLRLLKKETYLFLALLKCLNYKNLGVKTFIVKAKDFDGYRILDLHKIGSHNQKRILTTPLLRKIISIMEIDEKISDLFYELLSKK